ncbi:zinc finger CCCH domain-containing protein 11A isoform 4-T5 [Cyanocitta cristata]
MSNHGDDCYFFFYSTCNKGDSCAFRHCEAALGSETVCTLWQEGRCFRNVCRFRHMEIDKKRSEIACYWENQPGGCQKHNCAFHHTKGRYVDGLFLPPSKTTLPSPPEAAEDEVKMVQMQQNKLSVQSNPSPQLRGVMKVENSENVPSPTHPPVVINAADDDEDDDDQLSEEGEETKTPVQPPTTETHNGLRVISTRKSNSSAKQDDNLNFGIKTLEEIKLKKLKEKAKKQGEGPSGVAVDPLQARSIPVPEKENVRTVLRTVTLSSKEGEDPVIQLNLPDRLGKRKTLTAGKTFLPLRRNVADRLGRKAELQGNADKAPKRGTVQVLKSLKERLGLPSEQSSTETAPGREEKMIVELNKPSPKGVSASAENAGNSGVQVKSLEEIMWEKRQLKQRQEEKLQKGPIPAEKPEKNKEKIPGSGSGSPESAVGSAHQLGRRKVVKFQEDGVGNPEKDPAASPGKKGAQVPERKAKTKSKVCLKPLDGKATASPKQPLKRKGPEGHPPAVVAVKPLSATSGDTKEPSAKAVAPAAPEDNPGSIPQRENSQSSPKLHVGSQADSLAQSEVSGSSSSSSSSSSLEVPVKLRRLSSASSTKPPLSVEDDFEKLIWEISGGKLEAEIDLDPGKDEDDLLLELSEMIDS